MRYLKRDHYAAALVMLIGLGVILVARTYEFGTLAKMGPGFFPVALGVLLLAIGAGIGLTATDPSLATGEEEVMPLDIRGWLCIIAGIASFILFARFGGMAPATFACVFISALGDRTATVRGSAILALCVTVFAVAMFSYLLDLPMPVLRWDH